MWIHKDTFAIGGLENIGYALKSDTLIVLSSQGEGLFDCKSGTKIARCYNDSQWWDRFDQETYSLFGFDFLQTTKIKTHGLYGGDTLPKVTYDHWKLVISEPKPDDKPFENYLVRRIYLIAPDESDTFLVGKDSACELRAFGFSDTGESLVIALSSSLIIYSRV